MQDFEDEPRDFSDVEYAILNREPGWFRVDADPFVYMRFMDEMRRRGILNPNPDEYRFACAPYEALEQQRDYEQLKRLLGVFEPGLIEEIRNPHPMSTLPLAIQRRSFQVFLEPPCVDPVVFAPFCKEMLQVHAENDRHLTDNTAHFERVLENIDLSGMNVIEIGFGTGYLSEIVLRQNVNYYRGYDIEDPDPAEMPAGIMDLPHADFVIRDFREDDFSFMEHGEWVVLSNPPYFLIPEINRTIIEPHNPAGVVLITSQKRSFEFEGYTVESVQDGMDFDPPATGLHFVISDGFNGRWKPEYLRARAQKPVILGKDHVDCPSHKYGRWDMPRFSEYGIV